LPGSGAWALVAADESGALAEIAVGEQRFGTDPHRGGIGDMGDRIGHAELGRFDRKVLELGPVGVKAIEVAAIENAKRDQRSQPLTVRRQFLDADALGNRSRAAKPIPARAQRGGERHCAAVAGDRHAIASATAPR
jgi:hypothetical protein